MPVSRRLAVDRLPQIQIADDGAGAQVEVLCDQLRDLLVAHLAGAEGLHVDAERARHPDGVRHLDLAAVRQPGSHHVLGHPAARVRRGPIHLGGVLAAESAAAVPAHAAVGIHDDLAPGYPGVAHRSADDELAGRVDVYLRGLAVHQLRRQDGVDDVLHHRLFDLGVGDAVGVLGADEHRIHVHRLAVAVFNGHLALAVGSHPGNRAVLALFCHLLGELVRQVDGSGHKGGGLVAGVAEHHPLVTGADLVQLFGGHLAALYLQRVVHAEGNIRALAADGREHGAGVAVEAFFAAVVADLLDHLAHQFIEVDERLGGDLAEYHHKTGLGGGFAGHAAAGVLLQAGVQNGVGNLVAELVGVSFGHRLGREFVTGRIHETA